MVRHTGQRRGTRGGLLLALGTALLIAAAGCAAALAAPSSAGAASGRDGSFGRHGVLHLDPPLPPGVKRLGEPEWKAAPDGSTYIAGTAWGCRDCGGNRELLIRFDRGGRFDASFGGKGYVELPYPPSGFRLAVDSHGRPILSSGDKGTRLERFTASGHVDRSFGGDGKVWLPKLVGGPAEVEPLPTGGLLVYTEDIEGGHGFATIRLEELREGGAPVKSFGHDGHVVVDVAGTFHVPPAVTPNGSILIGATGCCTENFTLSRVSARGRLDSRFNQTSRAALRPLTKMKEEHFETEPELRQVLARPDGGVDLFGEFSGGGFDARIGADGRARPGFGKRGLRILSQPVEQALPLRGGGFLAVGQGNFGPSRAFVLRPGGAVDPRFDPVRLAPYSPYLALTAIGGRSVDVAYSSRPDVGDAETPFVARLLMPPGLEPRR